MEDGTQFYVFCGNTDLNNTKLENVKVNQWVPYNLHTSVWYAAGENRSEAVLEQIKLIKPDVLYVVGLFSWHFNLVPMFFSGHEKKIISVRGMLHPGALSQKKWKKKFFIACWKLSGLYKKVSFHATDETEANYIRQVFGEKVAVHVAANFPRKFIPQPAPVKTAGSLELLTIALISPMKNHLLVLQALEQCTGKINYHICGPVKEMDYWQQCLLQIKKLPGNITVQYHGELQPKLVQEYIDKAHVFILPSKSENFGHAIYESLSAGRPVITSHHTPWQELENKQAGLNIEPGISALKNAIDLFVQMESAEFKTWSEASVVYALDAYDLEQVKKQYSKMFA
jgi:glycosyltransferase involved in cell wall biosynthesis